MWACKATLLGQTRRVKPRDADGKSKAAKGVEQLGPQPCRQAAREVGNQSQQLHICNGTSECTGVLWRLETGAATLGLKAVCKQGPAVSRRGWEMSLLFQSRVNNDAWGHRWWVSHNFKGYLVAFGKALFM